MEEKKVAYQFRIGANTDEGISLEIAGNFLTGTTKQEMDIEIDRLADVLARQRAKSLLTKEEFMLETDKNSLNEAKTELDRIRDMNSDKSSDKMTQQNITSNIHRLQTQITARESGIASLKAMVG